MSPDTTFSKEQLGDLKKEIANGEAFVILQMVRKMIQGHRTKLRAHKHNPHEARYYHGAINELEEVEGYIIHRLQKRGAPAIYLKA